MSEVCQLIEGVSSDMEKATQLARSMITEMAMYPEILPFVLEEKRLLSQSLQEKIDLKVKQILKESIEKSKQDLRENKEKLLILSDRLMTEETLTGDQVKNLMGFNV